LKETVDAGLVVVIVMFMLVGSGEVLVTHLPGRGERTRWLCPSCVAASFVDHLISSCLVHAPVSGGRRGHSDQADTVPVAGV
jgi:hypothetical protein